MATATISRRVEPRVGVDESRRDEHTPCELSIVMPCLDEVETLGTCLRKAFDSLEKHGIEGEIIVADNGSTDGSKELANEMGARVIDVTERGYGAALAGGFRWARGEYVIMGDCDDSYDFSAIEPFVAKLREGHDLVMGNRFRGGIAEGAMPPLHQKLGNPVISWLVRLFFGAKVGDSYCGLRGFRRDAIERWGLASTGMTFALEIVAKATQLKMKIAEIPTTLSPDGRTNHAPHLNTWRDGFRSLRFLMLSAPRWGVLYPCWALSILMAVVAGPMAALAVAAHGLALWGLVRAAGHQGGFVVSPAGSGYMWAAIAGGVAGMYGWMMATAGVAAYPAWGLFGQAMVAALGAWLVRMIPQDRRT